MCIGNTVAWLMAIYMEDAQRHLIWNVMAGSAGAAACGLAFVWAAPGPGIAGLLFGGPVCAVLAILSWRAVRRRYAARR